MSSILTLTLLLALMQQESAFNPNALSSANASGLMQLTPIGVLEVQRQTAHFQEGEVVDLWHPDQNIEYGIRLLKHYETESRSLEELLALYNGGFRQRNNIRARRALAKETAHYIVAIRRRERLIAQGKKQTNSCLPYERVLARKLREIRDERFLKIDHSWLQRMPGKIEQECQLGPTYIR